MIRLFSRRFILYENAFVSAYSFIIERKLLIFLLYEFELNVTDFNYAINIIEYIFMMNDS